MREGNDAELCVIQTQFNKNRLPELYILETQFRQSKNPDFMRVSCVFICQSI